MRNLVEIQNPDCVCCVCFPSLWLVMSPALISKQDWVGSPTFVRRGRGFIDSLNSSWFLAEDCDEEHKKIHRNFIPFVHTYTIICCGRRILDNFILSIIIRTRTKLIIGRLISFNTTQQSVTGVNLQMAFPPLDENFDPFNPFVCVCSVDSDFVCAVAVAVVRYRRRLRSSWFSSPSFHVFRLLRSVHFRCQDVLLGRIMPSRFMRWDALNSEIESWNLWNFDLRRWRSYVNNGGRDWA